MNDRQALLNYQDSHYYSMLENMELGILEVNTDDVIVRAYPKFCEMLGYLEAELLGQIASDVLLPEKDREIIRQQHKSRAKGVGGRYELSLKKKDGKLIQVIVAGSAIFNENREVVGSLGVHLDISENKKLISELTRARKATEVAQLAEKAFVETLGNELKEPIASVLGAIHLLTDTQPTLEQREHLSILKNSAQLLQAYIADFLEVTSFEANTLEPISQEIDIAGIIRTQQKIFDLKCSKINVEVEAFLDARIEHDRLLGDEVILSKILNSLLKFGKKQTSDGKIGISVKKMHQSNESVTLLFQVYDTGIAISPKVADTILKGTSYSEIYQKGIGYSIITARKFVELLGGTLKIEGSHGKGNTFSFTLNFQKVRKTPILTTDKAPTTQLQILVVEDNPQHIHYIETLLKRWETDFELADSGLSAIEKCKKTVFDMLLLDCSLNDMDGIETAIKIRKTVNPNSKTTIIGLLNEGDSHLRGQVFEAGMNDLLYKPFSPEQLQEKIRFHTANPLISFVKTKVYLIELDKPHLRELYADDYSYAKEMFEIFLNDIVPEIQNFSNYLDDQSLLEKIRRFKPTLEMVGLTFLVQEISEIENVLQKSGNTHITQQMLAGFLNRFEKKLPLLRQQLQILIQKQYD